VEQHVSSLSKTLILNASDFYFKTAFIAEKIELSKLVTVTPFEGGEAMEVV
jgi:hypothetical protein